MEKWSTVLDHKKATPFKDKYRRAVTAKLLENTENALREERGNLQETPVNATGSSITNWEPVLISLVRRAMPNLIAYDIASVQPMTGPTGLIFAMKSRYSTQGGTEALFNEADTAFSGTAAVAADALSDGSSGGLNSSTTTDPVFGSLGEYTTGRGMTTAASEGLGSAGSFAEMAFSIEKATVTATARALKAEYTTELAHDLKQMHGLDAESELANMLSTEVLAEINREMIRTVNIKAKLGCQQSGITASGIFDLATDADGRWAVEKFKGLLVQIEREANQIAKETRRGKGNFLIVSSDVASCLAAAGVLNYAPALATNLEVDDTGNTFAGTINGRLKVFIDPYAAVDYVTVGYRGTNPYDAGIFYCPYVPLSMMKAVDTNTFQPKIGFKTRYGIQQNPFVSTAAGAGTNRTNQYFRNFRVANILST
jgi:hypothetical protein